ncbi:MAG: BREX-3 system P-loop-containing protein BrxF [Pirellula sp.]
MEIALKRNENDQMNPMQDVKQLLQAAPELYHRLILLVGATGAGKTNVLRELARDLSVPIVNVNLVLSSELLELTAKQRALRLPEIFARVTDSEFDPLLLDNLEILFDDHLKQDPLRLLHGISRNRTVVASWNGHATARKLVYAEPGHAEHRHYEIGDVMIVQMSGQSLVGSAGE